jgi:hypothetical protein
MSALGQITMDKCGNLQHQNQRENKVYGPEGWKQRETKEVQTSAPRITRSSPAITHNPQFIKMKDALYILSLFHTSITSFFQNMLPK